MGVKETRVENFGKITKAKAVLVSKQRNSIWFEDDNIILAKLFKDELFNEMSAEDISKMLPMDKEVIEDLGKLLDWDWDDIENKDTKAKEEKYEISIMVSKEVYNQWLKWKERCGKILGYDSDVKCFEFAIVEALNLPEESLK